MSFCRSLVSICRKSAQIAGMRETTNLSTQNDPSESTRKAIEQGLALKGQRRHVKLRNLLQEGT